MQYLDLECLSAFDARAFGTTGRFLKTRRWASQTGRSGPPSGARPDPGDVSPTILPATPKECGWPF